MKIHINGNTEDCASILIALSTIQKAIDEGRGQTLKIIVDGDGSTNIAMHFEENGEIQELSELPFYNSIDLNTENKTFHIGD